MPRKTTDDMPMDRDNGRAMPNAEPGKIKAAETDRPRTWADIRRDLREPNSQLRRGPIVTIKKDR